jgi:hypothetical protein
MTPDRALLGYTERELKFLELAATWSGYFVPRQFQQFIDRRPGATTDAFLNRLVQNGHASVTTHRRNIHLYHLCSRPLYNALRQENNRHRRHRPPYQIRTKLMSLDFALGNPALNFLTTEAEKVSFFSSAGIPEELLPRKRYTSDGQQTLRYFVGKMPIYTGGDGPGVYFAFVDGGGFNAADFDRFLTEHGPLFEALSIFGLVYVTTREGFGTAAKSRLERFFSRRAVSSEQSLAGASRFFELKQRYDSGGAAELTMDELRDLKDGLNRYKSAPVLPTAGIIEPLWSVVVLPHTYDLFGDV